MIESASYRIPAFKRGLERSWVSLAGWGLFAFAILGAALGIASPAKPILGPDGVRAFQSGGNLYSGPETVWLMLKLAPLLFGFGLFLACGVLVFVDIARQRRYRWYMSARDYPTIVRLLQLLVILLLAAGLIASVSLESAAWGLHPYSNQAESMPSADHPHEFGSDAEE